MEKELTRTGIEFKKKSVYKINKINYHVYAFYDTNQESVKDIIKRLIIQDLENNLKMTQLQ